MWVGNVFSHVCLSVRLSVHLSVCPSLCLCVCLFQAITFETLHIGTSFLLWRYILTISSHVCLSVRLSMCLSVQVITFEPQTPHRLKFKLQTVWYINSTGFLIHSESPKKNHCTLERKARSVIT